MPATPFVHLGGVENLKAAGPAQNFISDTLNAALKTTLINALTTAKESELATLLHALPAVDIVANAGPSLHEFVSSRQRIDKVALRHSIPIGVLPLWRTTEARE